MGFFELKVVVTGGAGFVGRSVVERIREDGHEVIPFDILPNDGIQLDMMVKSHVESALAQVKPDAVVHLAAIAGAEGFGGTVESKKNPYRYLHANYTMTLNLLESMRELGIIRLIHQSSFSVYGKAPCPITETTPFAPDSPYGTSKVCCEKLAESYSRLYPLMAHIVRPPLIAGKGQKEMNVLRKFVSLALEGKPLTIEGNGDFVREFLHPSDVADAISKILSANPATQVFVLGSDPISIRDLAEMVVSKVGGKIGFVPDSGRGFDQFTDNSKAEKFLGWSAKVSIESIVDEIVEDMK